MADPWEKDEYLESKNWARKAEKGELNIIPCISGWVDICGFGSALEQSSWNLVELQKNGLVNLLSRVYQSIGHPFLVGVEPMLFEKILIINDGVARSVDLKNVEYAHAHQFIFYLRDLFISHRNLLGLTKKFGYGVRTVFSGGERVQYSPEIFTGNSVLHHDDENISEYGKRLLNKNFLHNPSEFQMNTAFAKAYSIDSLGSASGFNVNSCFVEKSFWCLMENIPKLEIEYKNNSILFYFSGNPAFEVYFKSEISVLFKGIDLIVNEVEKIRIDKMFEGEETYIDITKPI